MGTLLLLLFVILSVAKNLRDTSLHYVSLSMTNISIALAVAISRVRHGHLTTICHSECSEESPRYFATRFAQYDKYINKLTPMA